MKLTPDFIIEVYQTFGLDPATRADASELCRLFGEREELLAYLILKTDVLTRLPQVRASIAAKARERAVSAQTHRPTEDRLLEKRAAFQALERAQRKGIECALAARKTDAELEAAYALQPPEFGPWRAKWPDDR